MPESKSGALPLGYAPMLGVEGPGPYSNPDGAAISEAMLAGPTAAGYKARSRDLSQAGGIGGE